MADNKNGEDYGMFGPEDVSDVSKAEEIEEESEFDGDEFEERYRRRLEEQAEQKRKRSIRIAAAAVGAVLIILLGVMFYYADSGVFGAYKKNFEKNFRRLFPVSEQPIYIGATEKNAEVQNYVNGERGTRVRTIDSSSGNAAVVPFEGAASGSFAPYRDGIVCARTNYICFIGSDGEVRWESDTTVVDPLLSAEGRYIAAASKGGTKLCLYEGENLVFEQNTENKIRTMSVSSNGDVVLVCDKVNYKGAISVYNAEGKEIFAWSSGMNNVISADISSASRRVAAALINADKKVYSLIKVFDINSKTDIKEMVFDDTVLYDIDYTGDTITGLGDNSMVCMTSTGRVICDKRFDMVDIMRCALDSDGSKLIHFDSAGTPVLHLYGRKGVLNTEIILDSSADCIDVNGEHILYSSGRRIMLRRAGGDRISEYTAPMDVLKLVLINRTSYAVIHSNSIEIVRV